MDKDTDLIFITNYIKQLVIIHNTLGEMNTLTYKDVFFKQRNLRERIKYIEEELGISMTKYIGIPLKIVKYSSKYLRLEE